MNLARLPPRARRLLGLLVLATACAGAQAGAPLIPVEDFAAAPDMSAPRLSPDGSHLVYITSYQGARVIAMYDVQAGHSLPIMPGTSGTFQVSFCEFKTDTRLLCHFHGMKYWMYSGVGYMVTRLVAVDRDGKNVKILFKGDAYGDAVGKIGSEAQDRVIHMLPDDPRHVLIEITEARNFFPSVYQLDIDNGAMHLVVAGRSPILGWLADHDGVVRFGSGFRDSEGVYIARNSADAPWRTLLKFPLFARQEFEPLAFGALPNQLFVVAPHQGRKAIWQMDLDEKNDFQLVFARPDVDVDGIATWPTDQRVVGFAYEDDQRRISYIDPHAQALIATIDQVVPNTYHLILSASRDGTRVLFYSASDVVPASYYLLNTSNNTLIAIGQMSKALAHAQLAASKPVLIPGPDGISIHGRLTLPVGSTPGTPVAAVVFPHGGPYARDHWGYDPLVQLMANRGYAVLQMEFRGSTGYGEAWRAAGHQQWGTIMHADITAGAHWLVSQGIADPARMCIVGWSFGGYAALIGVVKEPKLYKCAVAIAGVSDVSKLPNDRITWYGGKRATEDMTGTDQTLLAAESPVLHADQIKVPVLLVHGAEDSTVMLEHSEAMDRALERAGVKHELVVIPGGEHSLIEPAMRLALYTKLVEFLGANLGSP
jgi:dipeptidyl aminopeptidase/acylaminoacyl peptidase